MVDAKINMEISRFRHLLIKWGKENFRDFPWRKTRNPYNVLVAEILLHRTRADQVVPLYNEFLKKFPTIEALADASEDDVTELLHPLGLRWRAKLLHKIAKAIVRQYDGRIPSESAELELLPGVSHYIASAVRCFAFGYPEVLLDTNTVRILGRLFGKRVTDGSRRSRKFRELYKSIIDQKHPREFNYAMLDLGALLCTPSSPKSDKCPVKDMCRYGISVGG